MIEDAHRRYQVFVSSTFVDLQPERRSALEAILEIKGFPAGMEFFPSANDEQWAFIKRQIESSDYYIIIVGARYGSLTPRGISYTEEEFNYAVQLQIPIMPFFLKGAEDLKTKEREGAALRKLLLAFRKRISNGRLIRHFRNPDMLKTQIWQALANAFATQPRSGWVRAKKPPATWPQLPPRAAVPKMVKALSKGTGIIRRLIYVVMAMEDESDAERLYCVTKECDRFGFVAIHRKEVKGLVRAADRLETMHDLIGRAILVLFDLSSPISMSRTNSVSSGALGRLTKKQSC